MARRAAGHLRPGEGEDRERIIRDHFQLVQQERRNLTAEVVLHTTAALVAKRRIRACHECFDRHVHRFGRRDARCRVPPRWARTRNRVRRATTGPTVYVRSNRHNGGELRVAAPRRFVSRRVNVRRCPERHRQRHAPPLCGGDITGERSSAFARCFGDGRSLW